MGDTTTLWVVELLELWRNTGDDALLADLYPSAAKAIAWLIDNASPLGLPEKLYCTCELGVVTRGVVCSCPQRIYAACS